MPTSAAARAKNTATRDDLRNVAIIAHVDHGKTTLVDAMLRQSGAFREGAALTDRVMDSMDQERERGITILAKNTAVQYGETKLNIIDTPGHADFGGEVERGLTMVDGVLLLVDASEGPLPQTRFVLRKALEGRLPVVLVVNKIDRPDARIDEVVNEVEELFLDLDADEDQLEFPIVFTNAQRGHGVDGPDDAGREPQAAARPARRDGPAAVLRPRAPGPGAGHQPRRRSLPRPPRRSAACARARSARATSAGAAPTARRSPARKITELFVTDGLHRVPVEEAGPGEICAVAGIPEVTIGETLADADDPRPLPVLHVDDPSIGVTIATSTSPFAGRDGNKLTARQIQARLDQELIGNVSIRVEPTERPDAWEVQGRGELQLAVLVETMRREGFELLVGQPRVVTREIDGVIHEPMERMSIDVPEDFVGVVTQMLALRKGRMEQMSNHGTGWVRMDYRVPARGLIGFRTEFLTETRGTGIAHSVSDGIEPWHGELRTRPTGALVSDRQGAVTSYSCFQMQDRGSLFVSPGDQVYAGMVMGENARADDLDVNIVREKHLTNVRSATADELERLVPARNLSLDQAMEWLREDECVEVTPKAVRIRKWSLDPNERAKAARRAKAGAAPK